MKVFVIKFIVFLAAFAGIVYYPWVDNNIIGPFTTGISQFAGHLLQFFGANVTMHGNILSIPGFSVQVLGMCNGVEATLVLWSALLAFPAPWKYKLKGLLIGTTAVHVANLLRIISLLYLGAFSIQWFQFAHEYLWEMLIMLDILIVFLVWLKFIPRDAEQESSA